MEQLAEEEEYDVSNNNVSPTIEVVLSSSPSSDTINNSM
jgi:hypothetical protein